VVLISPIERHADKYPQVSELNRQSTEPINKPIEMDTSTNEPINNEIERVILTPEKINEAMERQTSTPVEQVRHDDDGGLPSANLQTINSTDTTLDENVSFSF